MCMLVMTDEASHFESNKVRAASWWQAAARYPREGSSRQALMPFIHQHFISLSLYYFPSLSISILSLKEEQRKKKNSQDSNLFREKELELKLMQLMPACHSTPVPFLAVFTVPPHYNVTMSGLQK